LSAALGDGVGDADVAAPRAGEIIRGAWALACARPLPSSTARHQLDMGRRRASGISNLPLPARAGGSWRTPCAGSASTSNGLCVRCGRGDSKEIGRHRQLLHHGRGKPDTRFFSTSGGCDIAHARPWTPSWRLPTIAEIQHQAGRTTPPTGRTRRRVRLDPSMARMSAARPNAAARLDDSSSSGEPGGIPGSRILTSTSSATGPAHRPGRAGRRRRAHRTARPAWESAWASGMACHPAAPLPPARRPTRRGRR